MIGRSNVGGTIRHDRGVRTSTALVALIVLMAGCKGADATKAATTPSGVLVGPENIAVVKTQEIRSGPAISGTLQPEEQATVRAEVGGAVLRTNAEQGQRVAKGAVLAPRLATRTALSASSPRSTTPHFVNPSSRRAQP